VSLAAIVAKEREGLGAELQIREQRGFEDDSVRQAFTVTHAVLEEIEGKLRAAEDSKQYTDVGLRAHRRTLGEDLILRAEQFDRKANADERTEATSEGEAWMREIAPPKGLPPAMDAAQLADMRLQLAGLTDAEQHEVLLREDEIGRLARRVAYTWPLVKRLGLPGTEAKVRARVVERADLGALHWRALEWRMLARRLRVAAGVEEPVRIQGRNAS